MSITSSQSEDGRTVTIHVAGRFDFAARQDFMQAYKTYARGEKRFVVDLENADYLDSSAMGMLLQLRDYGIEGSDIELVNGNDAVRDILEIANFDKLFKVA
jgi:anti-anti-sigma factor